MDVLKYVLEEISIKNYHPEIILYASVTYPFRLNKLFDQIIDQMKKTKYTSIIPSFTEYRSVWGHKNNNIIRLDEGSLPHDYKKGINIGVSGLGSAYMVDAMINDFLDEKVGLYKVDEFMSQVDIRDQKGVNIANEYLDEWWLKQYGNQND